MLSAQEPEVVEPSAAELYKTLASDDDHEDADFACDSDDHSADEDDDQDDISPDEVPVSSRRCRRWWPRCALCAEICSRFH